MIYELNAMLLPVVGVRSSRTFITEHAHTMEREFLPLSMGLLLKDGAFGGFYCRVPPASHALTDVHFMFVHFVLKCFHVTLVTPVIAVTCMEHLKLTFIIERCRD